MTPAGLFAFGSVGCEEGVLESADDALNIPISAKTNPMSIIRRVNVSGTLPAQLAKNEAWSPDGQTSNGKVPRAPPPPHSGQAQATVAVGFVLLLLVLVTTSQGGFQIGRWTPLALFALAVLLGGLVTRGRAAIASRH